MAERCLKTLRAINRVVAILVGGVFLMGALVVLVDIILRRFGNSIGGTDEISGYVMAIGTAWGMSYALLELAHVRIDFLRSNIRSAYRATLDLLAMFALASTVSIIAIQCWPVVATTLKNSSRANTPLETPLALVQIPWFTGWVWFAFIAWLTFIAAVALVWQRRFSLAETYTGVFPEEKTS